MIEISVSNLEKSYSGTPLLNGLTFQIHQGERVGLLGRNGTGKTTLFNILAGSCDYNAGSVTLARHHKIGLIDQIPRYPAGYTVKDVLNTAFKSIDQLERQIETLTRQMQKTSDDSLLATYGECMAAYEAAGGYEKKNRLEHLCDAWRITDAILAQPFESLSGGEKTRINLARLILENTDILLLDEPTNHLDIHTTEWLEDYLSQFKGTVLTISHDRYFLDRVVTRIIELSDGKAVFYSGNYTFYAAEKERRYQEQAASYKKEQNKVRQLEEAAEKLRLWAFKGMDKTYKRAISMEKRIERIQKTEKPVKTRQIQAGFSERRFQGNHMLTVEKLTKAFNGKPLFSNVNLKIRSGERIALLGDNGTGKSTLLKIILGEIIADSGRISIGPSVKIGYLPQIISFADPQRTLLEVMMATQNCPFQTARDRLAVFHFRGDDVFKPISALSGGERVRFRLCMMMDEAINLLILDEPTNHLDTDSREWIEKALAKYSGTLLFVSHDRYFIERFATRIGELCDGAIRIFDGGYREYQAKKAEKITASVTNASKKPDIRPEKQVKRREASTPKRLEKQATALEHAITALETQQTALQAQMASSGDNYDKVQTLYTQMQENDQKLAALYAQWEAVAQQLWTD